MAVDANGNVYTSLKETPEYQAMLAKMKAAAEVGAKLPAVTLPPPTDSIFNKSRLATYLADVGAAVGEVMGIAQVGGIDDPGIVTGAITVGAGVAGQFGAGAASFGRGLVSAYNVVEEKVIGVAKSSMSFTLKLVWAVAIIGVIGMIVYLKFFV